MPGATPASGSPFFPNSYSFSFIEAETSPEDVLAGVEDLELADGDRYSLVAYGTLEQLSVLVIDASLTEREPNENRYSLVHTAIGVGEVDIWRLDGEPELLADDLDYGGVEQVDMDPGEMTLGVDTDDDGVVEFGFTVPALGVGVLTDLLLVTPAQGGAVELLAYPPSDPVTRVEANCGDGDIDVGEVCDGEALGDESCESQGQGAGELACAEGCTAFDTSGCG